MPKQRYSCLGITLGSVVDLRIQHFAPSWKFDCKIQKISEWVVGGIIWNILYIINLLSHPCRQYMFRLCNVYGKMAEGSNFKAVCGIKEMKVTNNRWSRKINIWGHPNICGGLQTYGGHCVHNFFLWIYLCSLHYTLLCIAQVLP